MRTREYIQAGEAKGTLHDAMNDGTMDHMQTFDGELERLCRKGLITQDTALSYSSNPGNLSLRLQGIGGQGGTAADEAAENAAAEAAGKPELAGMME